MDYDGIAQVLQTDTVMAGIWIGDVGAAGTSELRVEIQRSPYISDDNEGRAPLGGGQSAQARPE